MALPDLYAHTPVELVPAQSLATFPVNTFLENLAIAPNGDIFVTSHEAGEIFKLDSDRNPTQYAKFDGKVTSIVITGVDSI